MKIVVRSSAADDGAVEALVNLLAFLCVGKSRTVFSSVDDESSDREGGIGGRRCCDSYWIVGNGLFRFALSDFVCPKMGRIELLTMT